MIEARGAVHVVPLRLVPAVAVEDLDAMVLAVGDVDPAVGVAADVVRDVELARDRCRARPTTGAACRSARTCGRAHCRSRRRRRDRPPATAPCACSGGTARRSCRASARRGCRSSAAPCRRACSGGRCGRRRRSARCVSSGAMWTPCARRNTPSPQERRKLPSRSNTTIGCCAAVERVDPVLRVDADRGDVGVELLPRRQLRPVVDDLVAIRARAQDDRHCAFPFSVVTSRKL